MAGEWLDLVLFWSYFTDEFQRRVDSVHQENSWRACPTRRIHEIDKEEEDTEKNTLSSNPVSSVHRISSSSS